MKNLIKLLTITLSILVILDCISTLIGINYYGLVETNKIVELVLSYNILLFILIKCVNATVCPLVIMYAYDVADDIKNHSCCILAKSLLIITIISLIAFYLFVVLSNLFLIIHNV